MFVDSAALLLDAQNAVTLHIAGRHQHRLERTQPEVVVRLVTQLLVT